MDKNFNGFTGNFYKVMDLSNSLLDKGLSVLDCNRDESAMKSCENVIDLLVSENQNKTDVISSTVESVLGLSKLIFTTGVTDISSPSFTTENIFNNTAKFTNLFENLIDTEMLTNYQDYMKKILNLLTKVDENEVAIKTGRTNPDATGNA